MAEGDDKKAGPDKTDAGSETDKLKEELKDVKKHLALLIGRDRPIEPKIVFTPRERKLRKYSGRKEGEISVDEFIDEAELLCRTRPTSDEEKVDFLISHLEGAARDELRYRTPGEKKTPQDVFDILRDVFGDKSTVIELLSEFNQCYQKKGPSLQEFSYTLMNKIDKVVKRGSKVFKERDVAIRNQFAENVRNHGSGVS